MTGKVCHYTPCNDSDISFNDCLLLIDINISTIALVSFIKKLSPLKSLKKFRKNPYKKVLINYTPPQNFIDSSCQCKNSSHALQYNSCILVQLGYRNT